MNLTEAIRYLDTALSDIQIIKDTSDALLVSEKAGGTEVELEDEVIFVPTNTNIEVVTKALFKDNFGTGFGTYKAQVAIGGIKQEFGATYATYCFATLFYNEDSKLITIDFHKRMR